MKKLNNTEGESKKALLMKKTSLGKKNIFKIDKAELFVTFLIA